MNLFFVCLFNINMVLIMLMVMIKASDLVEESAGLGARPDHTDEQSRKHCDRAAPAVQQRDKPVTNFRLGFKTQIFLSTDTLVTCICILHMCYILKHVFSATGALVRGLSGPDFCWITLLFIIYCSAVILFFGNIEMNQNKVNQIKSLCWIFAEKSDTECHDCCIKSFQLQYTALYLSIQLL